MVIYSVIILIWNLKVVYASIALFLTQFYFLLLSIKSANLKNPAGRCV